MAYFNAFYGDQIQGREQREETLETMENSRGLASMTQDRVILRRIPFNFMVGLDAWGREKSQPVYISVETPYLLQTAGANDDVTCTLDYGKLYKSLEKDLAGPFNSISHLVQDLRKLRELKSGLIEVALPKGNLRAEKGLHFTFDLNEKETVGQLVLVQSLSIRDIHCACIVGVNPHEREEKQIVVVNLDFKRADGVDKDGDEKNLEQLMSPNFRETIPGIPYAEIIGKVVKQVEGSAYQTVEALATAIAKTITVTFNVPGVWVQVEKPNAIAAIEAAGVRMYREKAFFTEDNFWQIRRP